MTTDTFAPSRVSGLPMTISDLVKESMTTADPLWAESTADLITSILERALQMSGPELSHFISDTPTMKKYAEQPLGVKEFESTRAIVAAMLPGDSAKKPEGKTIANTSLH